MFNTQDKATPDAAIKASWERCKDQFNLTPSTSRPILRLRSAEVAPRLEEFTERSGGRLGIISELSNIAANAGHCLVVTDQDGVLVRLEGIGQDQTEFEHNGIALGSCWDERIAGTNGVSMALAQGAAFTVSGQDHFFTSLRHFACTALPLFDAENTALGAISLSMVDRRNTADYLFATQLLGAAADRIQRALFERRFAESMIVSVASSNQRDLLKRDELVAVNEAGVILGSTASAHLLAGQSEPGQLKGKAFELMFGTEAQSLEAVPGRVLSVPRGNHPALRVSARAPQGKTDTTTGWRRPADAPALRPKRQRMASSLRQLILGSEKMEVQCTRALTLYRRALPFVIEGESGTGKSSLIRALQTTQAAKAARILTIDCAALDDGDDDRAFFQTLLEQARVSGVLGVGDRGHVVLVLENVDEMPDYAQAGSRSLMAEIEERHLQPDDPRSLRVIATSRRSLRDAVARGAFRDDLYYLLATSTIRLPSLREREKPGLLAQTIASDLSESGAEITDEALSLITQCDWPGNLRELRNALQQALINGDGRRISALDLRETVRPRDPAPDSGAPTSPRIAYDERTMILDALTGTRWNIAQAARNLGMGRATIHRKMKKFGITRPT
ncbi:Acetoin catabolism regulatory protein [Ruegeria sp. THAF57]|uniref:sigma-54-dependent Fis family transcriptional regulator n=1 Tax=Ruegeria sp. THAF57 TaxID=2744555 RepID=UPI0015DE0CC3|nr:sigma 54-interacting transcriptional regulator [Ruegeria sp. THAF57]CAD0187200.1 Acetoin catabolism regulatory protein [Ruegeria sp. THAF57]